MSCDRRCFKDEDAIEEYDCAHCPGADRNAKTTMKIVCCVCHEVKGEKDGHGQTGVTSTICEPCALKLLPPDLHSEYLRRKQLENEGLKFSNVYDIARFIL